uniref:Neogenin n=1 Tax=Panagrolaimus sp. PS1159 TaxID=55785 RepID=A0AC35G7L0_9BILA
MNDLIVSNGSLLIENVLTTDTGLYQCIVHITPRKDPRFTWSFLSKKAFLRVPNTEIFEINPKPRQVKLNQPTAFQCLLNSFFPAQIEWYKDDRRIMIEEGDGYFFVPISQSLEIKSVQQKHKGNYKCVVRENGKIRQSSEVPLQIISTSTNATPVTFILEPKSQISVNNGSGFVLECLAIGSPRPQIKWLRDSLPLNEDGKRIRRIGVEGSSLFIEKSEASDSGIYTCRAENGNDSKDISSTVTILVPPGISKKPTNKITQETSDVEFDCEISEESNPKPSVNWYKNGEKLIPSEYFVVDSGKLRILGLVKDDQGIYQCIAENEAGSIQSSAQLIVDSAATQLALTSAAASTGIPQIPSEPLGLKVTTLTSRVISLKWDPPLQPSGEIINYHVFYREEDSTRERTVTTQTTSATIGELRPGSVYVIRIAAENRVGPGKSTPEFRATTSKEQALPSRVRNLRSSISADSVEILWDPPIDNVDETIRYKLFYVRKDRQSVEEETQAHMTKTSYILHDLDKDTEYVIRVEAFTTNGGGPTSESIIIRTLTDIPTKPPENVKAEAIHSGSLKVSWHPPPPSERNGAITGYKIKYKSHHRGSKASIAVVEGDPGEYTLNGLESGTPYVVRLAAINQNGTGPYTDWVKAQTLLDDLQDSILTAPRQLKVHATHDSIFMSWDPPMTEGIIIRGYEIGWGPGVPDQEKARVEAHVRSYTIKGLKPSREYVVALRGFNNAGPGFPIYETIRTTSYGYGSSPLNTHSNSGGILSNPHSPTVTPLGVRAESESSSTIRLSWTDPSDIFNPFYTVRYSSSMDNNGSPRYVNTSENEITITDLRPNLLYEFAVKLIDSPHWSMAVSNKTEPAAPSSSPRDLTVIPPTKGRYIDPNTVTLNWQPPKYANGEISDYSVLYTHRPEQDDKEWLVDSVRGDQLSMTIRNLVPQTVYYFKIQARNVKGIGPFSSIVKYEPEGYSISRANIRNRQSSDNSQILSKLYELWETNTIYVVIGIISICFIIIIILLTILCVQKSRRSPRSHHSKGGYIAGRKHSSNSGGGGGGRQQPPDFWIVNGQGTARPVGDLEGTVLRDFIHHDSSAVDSPPPRYQTVPVSPIMTRSHPSPSSLMMNNAPLRQSLRRLHRQSLPPAISQNAATTTKRVVYVCETPYSSGAAINGEDSDSAIVGSRVSSRNGLQQPPTPQKRTSPVKRLSLARDGSAGAGNGTGSSAYVSDADSNGTISRSYHHSSASLEGRQRTPQIVYTGTNRQPITKIDLSSDHASSYGGSSTALQNQTPPPTLTDGGGYRTIRGGPNSNPLKSFSQLGGGPPPISPSHGISTSAALISGPHGEQRTAHIVRPIVIAPPSNRSSPLNNPKHFMAGKLPIGRATAQPRINMSGAYSPYASTRDICGGNSLNGGNGNGGEDFEIMSDKSSISHKTLQGDDFTTEDLGTGIDEMLCQLRELQDDFSK